ncbi:MAG: PAS domain-containing protein [Bacteroidales bacterium]|nr:PAS domain-containing protein [Bacteroidales bacterium]
MKKTPKKYSGGDVRRYAGFEKAISDQIIDNYRSMISIINRDYRYESVNMAFCKAHMKEREALLGKSLAEIWGDEIFSTKIKGNLDECFKGRTIRYEAAFSMPDSEKRYFEVVFRPVIGDKEEITHLMAETFDISDLKTAELQALELKEEIKDLKNTYQQRLLQAQKLETIGVLAGGIAHDFNNILATIAGYAEMLYEDLGEDTDSAEKAGRILNAVNRGKDLVNKILTFSMQITHEKRPVTVSEILNETLDFINSIKPSGISIRPEICNPHLMVLGDPTQLFRLCLNMVTNAIQAMEEKGGTLSVIIKQVEAEELKKEVVRKSYEENYVLLIFQDTGKGIEPSSVSKIFDPFYTTREPGKGSGLGLSVVYGIVKEMEGEIIVSSKPGQGSIFKIYLPLLR